MDTDTEVQTNLKIPKSLKDKLKAAAKENRRSMTAELIARLESTFEETRLYGHKLSDEVTAEDANDLQARVEAVEAAIHALLGEGEALHIARKRAQRAEQAEDQSAEEQGKVDEDADDS